jgi:hypothetical protein
MLPSFRAGPEAPTRIRLSLREFVYTRLDALAARLVVLAGKTDSKDDALEGFSLYLLFCLAFKLTTLLVLKVWLDADMTYRPGFRRAVIECLADLVWDPPAGASTGLILTVSEALSVVTVR